MGRSARPETALLDELAGPEPGSFNARVRAELGSSACGSLRLTRIRALMACGEQLARRVAEAVLHLQHAELAPGIAQEEFDQWWMNRSVSMLRDSSAILSVVPVFTLAMVNLLRPQLTSTSLQQAIAQLVPAIGFTLLFLVSRLCAQRMPRRRWVLLSMGVGVLSALPQELNVAGPLYAQPFALEDFSLLASHLVVGIMAYLGLSTPAHAWLYMLGPLTLLVTSATRSPAGLPPAVAAHMPAFLPFGLARAVQHAVFVLMCVQVVYATEAMLRAHYNALRGAELETQRLAGVLRLLLPASTATVLEAEGMHVRFLEAHADVGILFVELTDTPHWAATLAPRELLRALNRATAALDAVIEACGRDPKEAGVRTCDVIGSIYIASVNAPERCAPGVDPAELLCAVALRCRDAVQALSVQGQPMRVSIGVHAGPLVGGVIGGQLLPRFVFLGDVINYSSRLASSGEAGIVQVSSDVAARLGDSHRVRADGCRLVDIKGKGYRQVYFVDWAPSAGPARWAAPGSADDFVPATAAHVCEPPTATIPQPLLQREEEQLRQQTEPDARMGSIAKVILNGTAAASGSLSIQLRAPGSRRPSRDGASSAASLASSRNSSFGTLSSGALPFPALAGSDALARSEAIVAAASALGRQAAISARRPGHPGSKSGPLPAASSRMLSEDVDSIRVSSPRLRSRVSQVPAALQLVVEEAAAAGGSMTFRQASMNDGMRGECSNGRPMSSGRVNLAVNPTTRRSEHSHDVSLHPGSESTSQGPSLNCTATLNQSRTPSDGGEGAPATLPAEGHVMKPAAVLPVHALAGLREGGRARGFWRYLTLPLNVDDAGRPRGHLHDWLLRIHNAQQSCINNLLITSGSGIGLWFLNVETPSSLLMATSSPLSGKVGIAFLFILALLAGCVTVAHAMLRRAALWGVSPHASGPRGRAVAPWALAHGAPRAPGLPEQEPREAHYAAPSSADQNARAKDASDSGACIGIGRQVFFTLSLLISQCLAAGLFSQFARLVGLPRNTLATTQLTIISFTVWNQLQRAEVAFGAVLAIWMHHIAVIIIALLPTLASRSTSSTSSFDTSFLIAQPVWAVVMFLLARRRDAEAEQDRSLAALAQARLRTCQELVGVLLPPTVMAAVRTRLLSGRLPSVAYALPRVVMLQADIVGFTPMCASCDAEAICQTLHSVFVAFDNLCESLYIFKWATVGDAYLAAAGAQPGDDADDLDDPDGDADDGNDAGGNGGGARGGAQSGGNGHIIIDLNNAVTGDAQPGTPSVRDSSPFIDAGTRSMPSDLPALSLGAGRNPPPELVGDRAWRMLALAQGMHRICSETQAPDGSGPLRIRVGLHIGAVVAGVVGRQLLRYHLVGKAVSAVSALEQGAPPGGIRCSQAFLDAISSCSGDAWVPGGASAAVLDARRVEGSATQTVGDRDPGLMAMWDLPVQA